MQRRRAAGGRFTHSFAPRELVAQTGCTFFKMFDQCVFHTLQLEEIAASIGARIQKLGREEALRKIYQMKGVSPPKQLHLSSPSSPQRASSAGAYRTSLYNDAMDLVHKAQGDQK
jgi:hypothetical protein